MNAVIKKAKRGSVELTVEVGRALVAAIANGNTESAECRLAGVSTQALGKWLKRGERGEQPYADFAAAYRDALVKCETDLVGVIKAAGLVDWRAAEKLLSRRFPLEWSEHAARKAVYPNEGNAVAMAGFSITIHLHGKDEEHTSECRPAIESRNARDAILDVAPEKPPPDPAGKRRDPDTTLN